MAAFSSIVAWHILTDRGAWQAMGFSDDSDSKESACNVGDLGLIPGLGRSPGEGHSNPLQYCLENPHGQRSLAGYSPSGRKELDPTERLSTHTQRAGVHGVTKSWSH